ncbi:hypothetical protein TSMEX_002024 [Taenia solium]|eukprot:TsM_000182800 transcript=TsM_000182800 gene=TsM_000182800
MCSSITNLSQVEDFFNIYSSSPNRCSSLSIGAIKQAGEVIRLVAVVCSELADCKFSLDFATTLIPVTLMAFSSFSPSAAWAQQPLRSL